MAYRISKDAIENIADLLPDAFVVNNNNETIEVCIRDGNQGVYSMVKVVEENKVDEYKRNKRKQLLEQALSISKTDIRKRLLDILVNKAVLSAK